MSRLLARTAISTALLSLSLSSGLLTCTAQAATYPITPGQRATAQEVAQAGVPLSELSPNAPDRYTVKKGDTLWDISKLYLNKPWRWPELWGMNLQQIHNPHLIYPGQILYLDKSNGRARLSVARPISGSRDGRLSPRVRAESLDDDAIAAVPMQLIRPFLTDAVVFETDELDRAPRIVATQDSRVLASKGETAYVRGDVSAARSWHVFRAPKPLVDPETKEILGYEARDVGSAEVLERSDENTTEDGMVVPSSIRITSVKEEAGVGDRLAPQAAVDYSPFAPHAPSFVIEGRVVSVYGDNMNAGQNQIVALNRGLRDGIERGHVLALWHAGAIRVDETDGKKTKIKLPDERQGLLFVFKVFERVSYALILQVQDPVSPGDKFTQP
jgi:hypothetical protein